MYKIQSEYIILRIEDGAFIPCDERNSDYLDYTLWVAEGNTPLPADPIIPPIPSITALQLLIAAVGAGVITAEEASSRSVPSFLAASFSSLTPAEQIAAQITWKNMTVVGRYEPLVIAAAAQLGLNDEQVDAFFLQASTI